MKDAPEGTKVTGTGQRLWRGYKEGQGFQRGEGVGAGESQRHTLLNIIIMISNEVCGFK